MFKSQEEQTAILGVCVSEPEMVGRTEGMNFCGVRSARRAIDMLRMLSFDLVIVGMDMPDASVWDFVRRVRTGWAWQKWALVGGVITDQQEITARMFGAIKVYDVMPSSDELFMLTSSLREKAARAVLHQSYGNNTFRTPPIARPGQSAVAF